MKMDRNINGDGTGKYALVLLRKVPNTSQGHTENLEIARALAVLSKYGILDYGLVGTDREFMVMRLKDKYAYRGLMGYFKAIMLEDDADLEYAMEIFEMAKRAGPNSVWCKKPD